MSSQDSLGDIVFTNPACTQHADTVFGTRVITATRREYILGDAGSRPEMRVVPTEKAERMQARAKQICSTCTDLDVCLEYALLIPTYGVTAGRTQDEIESLRKERGITVIPEPIDDRRGPRGEQSDDRSGRSLSRDEEIKMLLSFPYDVTTPTYDITEVDAIRTNAAAVFLMYLPGPRRTIGAHPLPAPTPNVDWMTLPKGRKISSGDSTSLPLAALYDLLLTGPKDEDTIIDVVGEYVDDHTAIGAWCERDTHSKESNLPKEQRIGLRVMSQARAGLTRAQRVRQGRRRFIKQMMAPKLRQQPSMIAKQGELITLTREAFDSWVAYRIPATAPNELKRTA